MKKSIYDNNICGPVSLEIPANMRNDAIIKSWFLLMLLFQEAMNDVGRATLIHRTKDGKIYLSSVEVEQ